MRRLVALERVPANAGGLPMPFQGTSQTRPEGGGDRSENPSSSAGFAGAIGPLGEARRGPPRPPSMGNEVWRTNFERHETGLPGDRVTTASRVCARMSGAAATDQDGADGAGPPLPLRPHGDLGSERREGSTRLFGDAPLDLQLTGSGRVGPER